MLVNVYKTLVEPKTERMSSPEVEDCKSGMHLAISKLMEEKHVYTYKKLVVPMSMRSIYWKFFGFPATEDGDILTKVKIVCIICKTQIAYNRNTSNLRMHLQNKHGQELIELESNKPPKKQYVPHVHKDKRGSKKSKPNTSHSAPHIYTTELDGTVQIDGNIQFVSDPNVNISNIEEDMTVESPVAANQSPRKRPSPSKDYQISYIQPETNATTVQSVTTEAAKTVSDAITEFIIIDLQLPEIVEGRGFQRLVATLKSPCEIPSKNKLEDEIIPKVYDNFRESVAESLACIISEFGLAFEEWKSNTDEYFITISIYYQNPGESTLETKVLNTIHAPIDWNESQWGLAVDAFFSEWDLRIEKITAVVVATERTELLMALTNRGLTIVPCLLHTLQLCAQTCFNKTEVANILTKCRTIIGVISKSTVASESLRIQEHLLELEDCLAMDCPTVWITTYYMIEQMVVRRSAITTILEAIEDIDQETVELSNDQWKIMEDVVTVLEPFKVTIITLSEEKMPIISLLKPLLWQLVSAHMKPKSTDSPLAHSLKEYLSDMLVDRYSDANVTLLLQIATTLDPRFKQLPYATEEDKNMASKPIKEMLVKLIQDECDEEEPDQKNNVGFLSKKSRLSGMELLLGNLCTVKSEIPSKEKADLELTQYQAEPTASLDCCPLQWWTKISAKCPNLSKLARRYNCAPACCTPPNKISSEVQIIHDARRAALPPHLVDKLLFLHGNHMI